MNAEKRANRFEVSDRISESPLLVSYCRLL